MAVNDIRKVIELLQLKRDLHIICKSKIKSFAIHQIVANNKLFKIKYNKDDRNCVMEEVHVELVKAKQVLAKIEEARFAYH